MVKLGDEAKSIGKTQVVGTVFHAFLFSNELLPSVGVKQRGDVKGRMKLDEETEGNPVSGNLRGKMGSYVSRYLLAQNPQIRLTKWASTSRDSWNCCHFSGHSREFQDRNILMDIKDQNGRNVVTEKSLNSLNSF